MIKKLLFLIGLVVILSPLSAKAAEGEYIESMHSRITVNADSSLDIQEEIQYFFPAPKHGIFRILPTKAYLTNKTVKTPVTLISITNRDNQAIPYSQSSGSSTITWKIGDADKTIEGLQTYKIHYRVQNIIRFDADKFDEFYWNLNGNFWEVPINKYTAAITFPPSVTKDNTGIYVYSGAYGIKDDGLARDAWTSDNVLTFASNKILNAGVGITASVTFPKNIFTPPPPTFWEKYGAIIQYLFLIIPLLIFIISFLVWQKFGRDPKVVGPIVPEFGIPENLSPLEMGVLIKNGALDNKYISAAIVNLAVKKVLKIEETAKKKYTLILLDKNSNNISESEKILVDKLFGVNEKVDLEDLKNKFYEDIPAVHTSASDKLEHADLIPSNGWCATALYWSFVIIFFILIFILGGLNVWFTFSLVLSLIILIIFAILMPRRTLKGAQLMKKVEGFKLYMKTAERYRQEFNEKENIFEKFLPYAMVFGIVSEWTKSFAKIYEEIHGQDYFATYHPIWFASAFASQFNPDIFSENMTSLSSSMSSTLASSPSSSGSGGGGFSGGGGGGGGGGSW